uniref:Phosphorylated adapter RNA export protein n=1 Tax=Nannospalax galili TaxID=1026970 RepID=A0A8C6RYS7_NANGA
MVLEAGDTEDGQLSSSDSYMTVVPSDRPLPVPKVLGGDSVLRAFQSTATVCVPVSHYRIVKSVDSSEEREPFQFGQSSQKTAVAGGKKVNNNIWGAVLQEQSQDAVATELGILGMEGTIDRNRQSGTYSYLRESQECTKELDKEPVKDRLGDRLEMNYKRRLQEPKKGLIARVVRIIGNKKATELLKETGEVEQNGSLFRMNRSRRRTPGGFFLNLLKNTPSISEEQIKDIFYIEIQKEYENKKAARKTTQLLGKKMKQTIKSLSFQEDDDTSRETFASDTNEALASTDEPQEGNGDARVDAEEAIEVDHHHDLDIF